MRSSRFIVKRHTAVHQIWNMKDAHHTKKHNNTHRKKNDDLRISHIAMHQISNMKYTHHINKQNGTRRGKRRLAH